MVHRTCGADRVGGWPRRTRRGSRRGSHQRATDTYIAAWGSVGVQAFNAAGLSPAEGHTTFGYVAVAVYDAVMAVEGGYEPFAVDIDAPDGGSPEAAVAAAAHRILVHYLPAQAASIIVPAYQSSLATIPDGPAEMDGVATGVFAPGD